MLTAIWQDSYSAEPTIESCVLGRKAWLFVGSRSGGTRASVLMSLVATCNRCQVEPWAYLRALSVALPTLGAAPPDEQLQSLRPDR